MDLLNYIDNFKDDNKVKAQWRVHDNKFIVATLYIQQIGSACQKSCAKVWEAKELKKVCDLRSWLETWEPSMRIGVGASRTNIYCTYI